MADPQDAAKVPEDDDKVHDDDADKADTKEEQAQAIPDGMMPAAPKRRYGKGPTEPTGYVRVRLPNKYKGEIFAVADQIMGGSRLRVICEDGTTRLARIPGKLRRRMWIREGDLLIIAPWDFQQEKADVRFRYTSTQSAYLSRQGKIPESIDVF